MGNSVNQIATIWDVNSAFNINIEGDSNRCVTKLLLENSGITFNNKDYYTPLQLVKSSDIFISNGSVYWAFGHDFRNVGGRNVVLEGTFEIKNEYENIIASGIISAPEINNTNSEEYTKSDLSFNIDPNKTYTMSLSLDASIFVHENQSVPTQLGIYICDTSALVPILVKRIAYDSWEEPSEDNGDDGYISFSDTISFNVNSFLSKIGILNTGLFNTSIIIALLSGTSDYI